MQAAMRFVQMFLLVVVGVAFATPSTDRLKVEHQRVLDDLNAKADGGPPLDLDDSRVPEILNKGWALFSASSLRSVISLTTARHRGAPSTPGAVVASTCAQNGPAFFFNNRHSHAWGAPVSRSALRCR